LKNKKPEGIFRNEAHHLMALKQKLKENGDMNVNLAQHMSSNRIIMDQVQRDKESKEVKDNLNNYKQHLQLAKLTKLKSQSNMAQILKA